VGVKNAGTGYFIVNFGGGLYMVRIWIDRLQPQGATLMEEYGV